MPKPTNQQDRLKKLLDKVNSLNLGGGGWWRPSVGTSTIRILPPVGTMDYFFVEVGQHYIGDNKKPYYCPAICSEGQLPCPICQVNEALYRAGEKDAASKFRASRAFFMNVIDRSNPGQGVQRFAPGTTIFQAIASAIADPDYGDISDPDEGYDIKIERTGEGRENTKYQTRPVKRSTPLSSDAAQAEEWISSSEDLKADVMEHLMDFNALAKDSGVDVYFSATDDDEEEPPAAKTATRAKAKPKPEPEPDDEEDEEDEEPPARTASQSIGERIKARQAQATRLTRK